MTTVVTGASGHVGSNLVRMLQDDVRAVVHGDQRALEGLPVKRIHASLEDPASLRRAFRGAHTVYHLAAHISITGDPDGSVYATNVLGARNAAQAALAEGVSRFVHMSSVHAFDLKNAGSVLDETGAFSGPGNYAYDKSKAAGEAEIRAAVAQGLDATIVNPTGIIGPVDFTPSRMGNVFLDLASRRMPMLVSGAFDFVDVRDVVRSLISAASRGATGENYLLAGHRVSIGELARLASCATGVPAPRTVLPAWVAALGTPLLEASARRTGRQARFTREALGALQHCPRIDDRKARREIGHSPRPMADSVRDTYAWFRQRRMMVCT